MSQLFCLSHWVVIEFQFTGAIFSWSVRVVEWKKCLLPFQAINVKFNLWIFFLVQHCRRSIVSVCFLVVLLCRRLSSLYFLSWTGARMSSAYTFVLIYSILNIFVPDVYPKLVSNRNWQTMTLFSLKGERLCWLGIHYFIYLFILIR